MMVWAVIIGMGVLVFLNRYVFLEPRLPVRLSSNARQFLGFAVPGMLTAICGPIVFMPDKQLNLQWDNPYLISSLVAVGLVLSGLAGMTAGFICNKLYRERAA